MLGRVDSVRVVEGKASPVETRYYISSRTLSTADFAAAVRDHWAIENRLHWSLDVIFGEDARRLDRRINAAQNFSLLTKMALNLLRQTAAPTARKKSLRLRRKRHRLGRRCPHGAARALATMTAECDRPER
ncbi:MAG: ISAs1 family transposase [Comamonadaceae bacterium]|nr:ISAs1 family transposase [Comamonadaceae bacterium]